MPDMPQLYTNDPTTSLPPDIDVSCELVLLACEDELEYVAEANTAAERLMKATADYSRCRADINEILAAIASGKANDWEEEDLKPLREQLDEAYVHQDINIKHIKRHTATIEALLAKHAAKAEA